MHSLEGPNAAYRGGGGFSDFRQPQLGDCGHGAQSAHVVGSKTLVSCLFQGGGVSGVHAIVNVGHIASGRCGTLATEVQF